jgi:hypothetical protein
MVRASCSIPIAPRATWAASPQEVLSHLSALPRARLSITIEIVADVPDGMPEDIQRTVLENGTTLRFKS